MVSVAHCLEHGGYEVDCYNCGHETLRRMELLTKLRSRRVVLDPAHYSPSKHAAEIGLRETC